MLKTHADICRALSHIVDHDKSLEIVMPRQNVSSSSCVLILHGSKLKFVKGIVLVCFVADVLKLIFM